MDFSLDRCARGFGLGADLLRLGLQVMEQTWGSDIDTVAEVLKSNQASNVCFSRTGFIQEADSFKDQLSELLIAGATDVQQMVHQ